MPTDLAALLALAFGLIVLLLTVPLIGSRRRLPEQDRARLDEMSTMEAQTKTLAIVSLALFLSYFIACRFPQRVGIPGFVAVTFGTMLWRFFADFRADSESSMSEPLRAHIRLMKRNISVLLGLSFGLVSSIFFLWG